MINAFAYHAKGREWNYNKETNRENLFFLFPVVWRKWRTQRPQINWEPNGQQLTDGVESCMGCFGFMFMFLTAIPRDFFYWLYLTLIACACHRLFLLTWLIIRAWTCCKSPHPFREAPGTSGNSRQQGSEVRKKQAI